MANLYPPPHSQKNQEWENDVFCLLPGFILDLEGWAFDVPFCRCAQGLSIYPHKQIIITQFVLTICLACEGLSLDFAAIAANSTSFFSASIFELRDFTVWNKKQKHMKHKL